MRTEFRPDEKAALGPPHPGDFGIPKEHWDKAQYYANYWHENQVAAQRPYSFAGLTDLRQAAQQVLEPSDFQKWSVLAFRALDDAGRVLMTIEPESTTEGERLDQLKETIRELLTQVLLLNGVWTRRQLDERFQFGKLDTDALNVQLGQQQAALKQQAEPVAWDKPSASFAGLTLTEVRVPFGMTVRFEGGALIVETVHNVKEGKTPAFISCDAHGNIISKERNNG